MTSYITKECYALNERRIFLHLAKSKKTRMLKMGKDFKGGAVRSCFFAERLRSSIRISFRVGATAPS